MKREWQKPQIKVLVKGTPEESVLWACKGASGTGGTPGGPITNICGIDSTTGAYCDANNVT